MRSFLFLAAVLVLPALAAAQERRPDVLFVAVDDLNDWIGALEGHPQTETPNLDRLASRSQLFTKAYCAAPACNPSRAALMTGRAPWRSGVYYNPQPWRAAMPDAVTLTQHLRSVGYTPIGSGKIFHSRFQDPGSWDAYWPSETQPRPADPTPENEPLNGIPRTSHFDWGPLAVEPSDMGDWKVADWVIEQLQQPTDKPRFLACGIFRPHLPWYVPEKYFADVPEQPELPPYLENDLEDVPQAGIKMAKPEGDHAKVTEHDQWHEAVRGYLASIRFADEQIGRVLDALDESGRADNTIVVLWGDHGWHLGEKQHWRKFALWERATRVPLMISVPAGASGALPDGTQAGSRCDAAVSLLDLYPTIAQLCGAGDTPPVDGRSLVPLLKDPASDPDRAVVTTHGRLNHAVRQGPWRYIRYADGSEELYDHRSDPNEWKNLAANDQHAETIQRLRQHLPKTNAPNAEYDR